MIAKYNRWSFVFGVPGLLLQGAGFMVFESAFPRQDGLPVLAQLVGTVLVIIGLGFYAKAKGRDSLWGLLGLLSIVGFVALALLSDRAPNGAVKQRRGWAVASARRAGAPAVTRTQHLQRTTPIQHAVGDHVEIVRGGQTVAVLPTHAAAFVGRVAVTEIFTAEEALAWESTYEWEDVAAVLGMLVKVGILTHAPARG